MDNPGNQGKCPHFGYFGGLILPKFFIIRDGAGSGNRTRMANLEGWSFTTKLYPRFLSWAPWESRDASTV